MRDVGHSLISAAFLALVVLSGCSDATIASNNRAPDVQILVPTAGSTVSWGAPVEFCLRVSDPDTSHEPASLVMLLTSSASGVLWSHDAGAELPEGSSCAEGTGNLSLTLSGLPEGIHELTAVAWDPLGASGQATGSFTVVRPTDERPGCMVLEPASGLLLYESQTLILAAQVSDGDDPVATLVRNWTSSIEGALGEGVVDDAGVATLGPLGLSAGDHYLALSLVDPRGEGGACGVPITVLACGDLDGDGVSNCDGDCDDLVAEAYPEATELADGIDNDCDGEIDDGTALVDDDGDGSAEWQGDCDDSDPSIRPGAPEVPDGIDQDCDGQVDEGTALADDDGDGFCEGPGPCSDGSVDGDCDDSDLFSHPDAVEIVCDGVDQSCLVLAADAPDSDGDGYDACDPLDAGDADGLPGDCDDGEADRNPGLTEILCDGLDGDCDASSPDGPDADGDGFDLCPISAAGDTDGASPDCDDGDFARNPGEEELADGIDQDCDTLVDEGTEARDDDGDGWCEGVPLLGCTDGAGIGDCDDALPFVHPLAPELPNLIDDDCDTVVDDNTVLYDDDGDGYSEAMLDCDDGASSIHPGAIETADAEDQDCDGLTDEGTTVYDDDLDGWSEVQGDCDDTDPLTSPGSLEAIDGEDDDCDGDVDEGTAAYDDDGDGFTELAGDCNDAWAVIFPGAAEDGGAGNDVGEGTDNDCDGFVDEGTLTYDDDGDGWTELLGDCDDAAWIRNPDADEICANGMDDDCEGTIDLPDNDSDGFVDELCGGTDCDDGDPTSHPGGIESFDLADDDCDGAFDEGYILAGMVVISEIMKDPSAVGDPLGEWFEVHNPGSQPINLHGWTVSDDGTNSFVIDEDVIVVAGGWTVLGTNDNWSTNGGYDPDFVYAYSSIGGMQLGNSSDEIVLHQGTVLVDEVAYLTIGWPDPVGASLVLEAASMTAAGNDVGGSWCSATIAMPAGDEGTPGGPGGC